MLSGLLLKWGQLCTPSKRSEIKSANLPGSKLPILSAMCTARAPPIVASSNAWRAGKSVGLLRTTFANRAASRTSSNISRSLLLAGPSVPIPTLHPMSNISGTGAIPLESFRLLEGLCAMPAPCFFNSRISRRSIWQQWAASSFVSRIPCCWFQNTGDMSCCSRQFSTSSNVSEI